MKLRSFLLAFAFAAPWAISAPTSGRQEMHLPSRLNRTVTARVADPRAEDHHYLHRTSHLGPMSDASFDPQLKSQHHLGSFDTKTNVTHEHPTRLPKRRSFHLDAIHDRKHRKQDGHRARNQFTGKHSLVGNVLMKRRAERQHYGKFLFRSWPRLFR